MDTACLSTLLLGNNGLVCRNKLPSVMADVTKHFASSHLSSICWYCVSGCLSDRCEALYVFLIAGLVKLQLQLQMSSTCETAEGKETPYVRALDRVFQAR
jgi:hypothetical protein